MTTAFFHATDLPAVEPAPASRRLRVLDPGLRALLARKDDRLLRDISLSREDVLEPGDLAHADWARNREIWTL